jgi:phosphate uptake regulator/aminoglycoside phosphotransferase (APT) family kinase protein
MLRQEGIDRNFRFLAIEVIKQVERAHRFLKGPDPEIERQIKSRDDYIDHLKGIIENKSFAYLRQRADIDKKTGDMIRSLNVVTANLERIADHAVNIVGQTAHFTRRDFLERYDYDEFFEPIVKSLRLVNSAFKDPDLTTAIEICDAEGLLDELYKQKFERLLAEMVGGREVPDLVTALFIFHYLERMGDCLLNIGEAVIFYKMGEKLKFHQYQTLKETLDAARRNGERLEDVDFQGIWGTRSGCRIGKISEGGVEQERDAESREVIFKEGDEEKIRQEKNKMEQWSRLVPGLAPRVVEYTENVRDAALLMEYLEGYNLQEIVLNEEPDLLEEAAGEVVDTIRTVWEKTINAEPAGARFLAQLRSRLEDVYRVHPYFESHVKQIGPLRVPGFSELVEENLDLDELLVAPFSVFAHGDFNLDNVIYDAERKKVHFIDVHRSELMDYVQDVSVFLVSNFRIPVFDRKLRARLNRMTEIFYDFASSFAGDHDDETFEARIALGLVRSFVTSTRFESERFMAEEMFRRALYLLERVSAARKKLEMFHLPKNILYY